MNIDYSLHYGHWHSDTEEHASHMRKYFASTIAPLASEDRAGRCLDIGCGFGYALLALHDLGFPDVEGVEISPQQAERARGHGLKVAVTDDVAAWLQERTATFSHILLLDVIEHVPHEKQIALLSAAHDSLVPGGRVIVQTANASSILAMRWRHIDFTHYASFTEHSLRFALANAGYARIDISSDKGLGRLPLRFWRRGFVHRIRKFLVRWWWLQVFKAELPYEDLRPISFELNLIAVAHKSEAPRVRAPSPSMLSSRP